MKAQIINTDFLYDGKYYIQNSIVDLPPDIIKKYPHNLLAADAPEGTNPIRMDSHSVMIQNNSDANNMLVPLGIIKTKKLKKNKTR